LGAIYEHAARSSIFDSFEREIARPIGMEDYVPSDGKYATGAASVYPAYPIQMSARDLARFALLYLSNGKWRDHQILPVNWVKASTQPYSQSDLAPGYGYLWWIGFRDDALPQEMFFASGYGGQFAFVLPPYDLVIVHRVGHPPDQLASSSPSLSQIGRLLRLILDAAPAPDLR
jgi:CubicO group peptidase (beta-lactamase class C family)